MHPDDPERFADIIGARLRQLPLPRAPRTLLPRVMAAAQQWSRRPWYERAWFSWPIVWQIASIAVFTALSAGTAMLLSGVEDATARLMTVQTIGMGDVAGMIGRLDGTMNAAGILWRTIGKPIAAYAL